MSNVLFSREAARICMLQGVKTCLGIGTKRSFSIRPIQQLCSKARTYLHPNDEQASQRIHILGLGNIGMLFAHGLATKPNPPPITLLFHRKDLLESWETAGKRIIIMKDGVATTSSGYDVEVIGTEDTKISNLIVATKASNALDPLKSIAHRLDSSSIVLFAQNGMGVIPFMRQSIKDFNSTCYAAIITHGLNRTKVFRTNFAGVDKIMLGESPEKLPMNPKDSDVQSPESSQSFSDHPWMITQILSSSILTASLLDPITLQKRQLEKLMTNAVINPLTAILRVTNGELIAENHAFLRRLMRGLVAEMKAILKEEQGQTNAGQRHQLVGTFHMILRVAKATAKNQSSMLQDMLAGRETEIDWINGWFVREGQRLGLETPLNSKLVMLVKEKRHLDEDKLRSFFGEDHIPAQESPQAEDRLNHGNQSVPNGRTKVFSFPLPGEEDTLTIKPREEAKPQELASPQKQTGPEKPSDARLEARRMNHFDIFN